MDKIIIAIDGHSACGKSTLAKALARELKYIYVDSGAMYRAVTYYCLQNGLLSKANQFSERITEALNEINISFTYSRSKGYSETYLNGINVEEEIRTLEVSQYVSEISTIKAVREKLVQFQQRLGKNKGIVMDGRDIGTVVFPNAELKLWVTASIEVRTARRYKELIEKGHVVSVEEVRENVLLRDQIDSTRTESPLKRAEDAVDIDNSHLSKEETLHAAIRLVEDRISRLNAH
jgi:cytidylate kinase